MDKGKSRRKGVAKKKHAKDDPSSKCTPNDSRTKSKYEEAGAESSDSDMEVEQPPIMRKVSTHKQINSKVSVKEGFLLLNSSSFQKWKLHYFKLRPRRLFYARTKDAEIFEEVTLTDCSVAERSTKNVNCSFSIITPFHSLILCADSRRQMDEWISAIKAVQSGEFYEPGQFFMENFSGGHNWYTCTHARPTYCNVCREVLSGVMNHGLSCEVCKFKAHKRCAAKAVKHCKWAILSSVGQHIIENEDGVFIPHQWMEGNLPVSAKCVVCDKTCGSVLRLQDWKCLWCRAMVHTSCRSQLPQMCPLGTCRMSTLPPTALSSMDSDGYWQAVPTSQCSSPLLVFVNSKSGDNQGVKFYRRFRQHLNPAQVFDLMCTGPRAGLRMFQKFDSFRILVCGGDGSVGWVLSEMDKMNLHKKAQVGVLPLGTGNDLAQVMGWGNVCDDDTQVPVILERYERASAKLLDRWSISTYEIKTKVQSEETEGPISDYENTVADHLTTILNSERHSEVLKSATVLCRTIKDFVSKVKSEDNMMAEKCHTLEEKLNSLLNSLEEESKAAEESDFDSNGEIWSELSLKNQQGKKRSKPLRSTSALEDVCEDDDRLDHRAFASCNDLLSQDEPNILKDDFESEKVELDSEKMLKNQKNAKNRMQSKKASTFQTRENLWHRADSLKKAVRQIIEHTEKAVDEQNEQTLINKLPTQVEEDESSAKTPVSSTTSNADSTTQVPESSSNKLSLTLSSSSSTSNSDNHNPMSSATYASGNTEASTLSPPREHFPKLSPRMRVKGSVIDTQRENERRVARTDEDQGCSRVNPDFLTGGGLIGRVLLANTDALCAAATPLFNFSCPIMDELFTEKCVMNNYFGIGLDAKIALDFHRKREEHPKKCSRTKNMVWYGIMATREFALKTYKNLEKRIILECDGQRIDLPRLQGIVVLNIPSFMGGSNFWGGRSGNHTFMAPSYNDKVLEVVAVYGTVQLGMAMVVPDGVLQSHRIAQCKSIKITITEGDEIPLQVDGEAWLQRPGIVKINHKNRAQMLSRDRNFEETLKSWVDKQQRGIRRNLSVECLTDHELAIIGELAETINAISDEIYSAIQGSNVASEELLSNVVSVQRISLKMRASVRSVEMTSRSHVSDLIGAIADLSTMISRLVSSKNEELGEFSIKFEEWLDTIESEMKKLSDFKWLSSLMGNSSSDEPVNLSTQTHKNKFRIGPFSKKSHKKESKIYNLDFNVNNWTIEGVGQWLETIQLQEYKDVFAAHEIRGEELMKLETSDIKVMGITKVGHIKRIQSGVKDLQKAMNRSMGR